MIEYLQPALRGSKVFKELYRVQDNELQLTQVALDDLGDQLDINKATWALNIYEKELGIKENEGKTLGERREVIKSKWRGAGKLSAQMIKDVVDAYTNGKVDVGFNGRIIITFNGSYGTPPNTDDVRQSIEDIKPAHLAVVYEYMYLYIKDIHLTKSLEELETITLDKFAF